MAVNGKPTLIERIVGTLPGPYVFKSLLFSCLFGVPLLLLTRFVDTLDVQATLAVFGPLLWQNVITFSFANFVLLFYALLGVRYMRSKISFVMPELELMAQDDSDKDMSAIFKSTCRLVPALFVSILLVAVSLASFPDQVSQHSAGAISLAQVIVSFPFAYLAYGTFIWFYSSSVKCLYSLGKQHLRLAEFDEDAYLGMKPFGSLSLSLALVYFAGLGLVFFSFLSIPAPLAFAVGAMILGGIVLFFLPLIATHGKMRNKKQLEREKFKTLYEPLMRSIGTSFQNMQRIPAQDLKRLVTIDIIDRNISSIAEWPLDSRTVTWLSAIVLSVVGSILTRYVTILLGI